MPDTAADPIVLEGFDPAELLIDTNARTGAAATVTKADVALCKTIAGSRPDGCGNNVPIIIVRRPDGQLRVRAGHRRTIGCLRAGVPVLGFVAGDEGDEQADRRARLIVQWNENHHRVAMTVRDETAVMLALFEDEGMSEAAIAKATGQPRPQVAASLTVARCETAVRAAEQWDFLDLFQAATLAEFDGDEMAMTALIDAAKDSPSRFDHTAATLRATRAEREAKAAFIAELEGQGFTVYGDRPLVPWTLALENLRDADGNEITSEAHATCPGRGVTISYDWDWAPGAEAAYRAAHGLADDEDLGNVEFLSDEEAREAGFVPGWRVGRHLCTDPEQCGHTNVHGSATVTPARDQGTAERDPAAEAARKAEERRRVRQRNTAWRAATEVRTAHLKALLGRKAPPAGALKLTVEAMARGEVQPQMSSVGHEAACELLGLTGNSAGTGYRDLLLAELAHASEKRAQVIALAIVLGAAEHGARDVHTWQSAEDKYWGYSSVPRTARYLAWLAAHTGYALSDIEGEVAAHATGKAAQADDGGDPDESEPEDSGAEPDGAHTETS